MTVIIMNIITLWLIVMVLRIVTWNVRGAANCLSDMQLKLDGCDVMAITEHWLDPTQADMLNTLHSDFTLFTKFHTDHNSKRGAGGVALFIRNSSFDCITSVDVISNNHLICAKLVTKNTPLYIVGVRLPSSNCLDSVYYDSM
mgnify:CR=1 FL=1